MKSLYLPYTLKTASDTRIHLEYPNIEILYRDGQFVLYRNRLTTKEDE